MLEKPLGSGDILLRKLLIRCRNKNTLNCTIRNKPVTEGPILYDPTYMRNSKLSQTHRSRE